MSTPNSNTPFHQNLDINLHFIVPFDSEIDKVSFLDLSPTNDSFTEEIYRSEKNFNSFIDSQLESKKAKYLIGGYAETRNMYLRSQLFDENLHTVLSEKDEPRNLHLGVDIWGKANTPIMAPLDGTLHSMANNNNFGDYGPTIILQHNVEGFNFYTLYGHVAIADLIDLKQGDSITRGEIFAHFGNYNENGNWPPHLHFQIILDINEWEGDYPGVCKPSEASSFLANSPDADLILRMKQYAS